MILMKKNGFFLFDVKRIFIVQQMIKYMGAGGLLKFKLDRGKGIVGAICIVVFFKMMLSPC